MLDLLGLSPEETKILRLALIIVAYLLLTWGVYLWLRRFLHAWVKLTATPLDNQILASTKHSLLPLMALGVVYLLFSFAPVPLEFAHSGKRITLALMTIVVFIFGTRFFLLLLEWLGERYGVAQTLVRAGHSPIWAIVSVMLLYILLVYFLGLSESTEIVLRPIMRATLILLFAWFLTRGVTLAAHVVWTSYGKRLERIDPARARSFETLVGIAQYVVSFTVMLIASGAALSQFTFFQALAGSLLASAGIAGLVIGLAAQRTLGNLFAGIQLAFAQPVRIGDAVVFEGEWGVIEEISLSYVIIRVWDLRRLVIPITYFLDRPIQNWTRTSPELLGTVYVYTDYQVDVEAVRQELGNILQSTPLWDKKAPPILQVTDCKQGSVELRALCSAANASAAWDLWCFVREKLLTYIQQLENGRFLPRTRVELDRSVIENLSHREVSRDHPSAFSEQTSDGSPVVPATS
jgi:small-conductance mechanosensitive channel